MPRYMTPVSFRPVMFLCVILTAFLLPRLDTQAQADAEDSQVMAIRSIEGVGRRDRVQTPRYTTTATESRAPAGEWGRITLSYATAPAWIDELTFEYYALLMREERGERPEYTLFRGSVTYMEIEQGRNKQSAVFLRPNTLKRYGEIIGVAVEVTHEGQRIASESQELRRSVAEDRPEWWRNPNLTPRDGYILNRSQTPFALIEYDRYEAIKP